MLVRLDIVCRVSVESVRLLIAAQVAHHLSFAKGLTTFKLMCAVQRKTADRLVLREMHANREYVPEESVAYAHQTLIVGPVTSAMVSEEEIVFVTSTLNKRRSSHSVP